VFDFLNGFFADGMNVVRGFVTLAAAVIFLWTAISTRLAVGRTLLTAILAGFVVWAVAMNGLGWFSERVADETASPSTISQQAIL
jgi:hypothetical protein